MMVTVSRSSLLAMLFFQRVASGFLSFFSRIYSIYYISAEQYTCLLLEYKRKKKHTQKSALSRMSQRARHADVTSCARWSQPAAAVWAPSPGKLLRWASLGVVASSAVAAAAAVVARLGRAFG